MNLPKNNPADIWHFLFTNQHALLQDKAHSTYLKSLDEMSEVINAYQTPDLNAINLWFQSRTGWEVVKVPGLIKDEDFFRLLAEKKFPSSQWLRDLDHLTYLEEPDMFHDIFGHIPLLVDPVYSEIMVSFGRIAEANDMDEKILCELQKLYWFTIEFGLMVDEMGNRKILGAGILSSAKESEWSLLNESPRRKRLNLSEVLNTDVITDEIQHLFYIADDLHHIQQIISVYEHLQKDNVETDRTEIGSRIAM